MKRPRTLPTCACGGKWHSDGYYLHTDGCTASRRRAFLKRLDRHSHLPHIMTDCEECRGTGRVEATCSGCGVGLTELNVEPGEDSCCAKCVREDASMTATKQRCQSKMIRYPCRRVAKRWIEPAGSKYALMVCTECAAKHVQSGDRDGGRYHEVA